MRLAIGVEYDGTGFNGWQRLSQPGEPGPPTIQAALEQALSKVADSPVATVCAGRTDAGVHAACQVAHFDSDAPRTARAWVLGSTGHLPPGIAVRWCVPVADDFHARFSARAIRPGAALRTVAHPGAAPAGRRRLQLPQQLHRRCPTRARRNRTRPTTRP